MISIGIIEAGRSFLSLLYFRNPHSKNIKKIASLLELGTVIQLWYIGHYTYVGWSQGWGLCVEKVAPQKATLLFFFFVYISLAFFAGLMGIICG